MEGEPAQTEFVTLSRAGDRVAWMALYPHTGRTHQLRAHMLAMGHPILGDPKYGTESSGELSGDLKLQLHARRLVLAHPSRGRPDDLLTLEDAAKLAGLTPKEAGQQLQSYLNGTPATQVRENLRSVDVLLRSPGPERRSLGDIGRVGDQQAFLLRFSDTIRPLIDATSIATTAIH